MNNELNIDSEVVSFLDALGISKETQSLLPQDMIDSAQLLYGMQKIYAESEDSPKKDFIALPLSEMIKVFIQNAKDISSQEPKKEEKVEVEEEKPKETKVPKAPQMPQPPQQPQPPSPPKPSKPQKPKKQTTPPTPPKPSESPCDKYKDDDVTLDELKETLKLFNKLVKKDPDLKEEIDELKLRINCKQSTI